MRGTRFRWAQTTKEPITLGSGLGLSVPISCPGAQILPVSLAKSQHSDIIQANFLSFPSVLASADNTSTSDWTASSYFTQVQLRKLLLYRPTIQFAAHAMKMLCMHNLVSWKSSDSENQWEIHLKSSILLSELRILLLLLEWSSNHSKKSHSIVHQQCAWVAGGSVSWVQASGKGNQGAILRPHRCR